MVAVFALCLGQSSGESVRGLKRTGSAVRMNGFLSASLVLAFSFPALTMLVYIVTS
jgi:hypothetical protein